MTNSIAVHAAKPLPSMTPDVVNKVRKAEAFLMQNPQVPIATSHVLHAGVYSRTIVIVKGVVLASALIKRSTNLVISGHVRMFVGEGTPREYKGFHCIPASAKRKQIIVALKDTHLTMFFATNAATVEEAEEEFTEEADMLVSRQPGSLNNITITGE